MQRKLTAFLIVLCFAFFVGLGHAKDCEPTTYSNVPPETFECMKIKLEDYGIYVPPGDGGDLSGKGVAATFLWDGNSSLTLQITKKPLLVSCGTADNEIKKFVKDCQGSKKLE